jgi:hypothetical protein
VLERVPDLARRARVDPHGAERPHERQNLGVALRLDRHPEPERRAGALERLEQRASLLGDPLEVVHERRRPVLAREPLGVATGHEQPAIANLQARSGPPRGPHHDGRGYRTVEAR